MIVYIWLFLICDDSEFRNVTFTVLMSVSLSVHPNVTPRLPLVEIS